jgi:hypothetical protein
MENPAGSPSLRGKLVKNSYGIFQQNTQAQMLTITIAVALTHEGLRTIVLAFNESIGKASGQKLEKGQDFLPPIRKGRQRFFQVIKAALLDLFHPGIEALSRCSSGGCSIPGTQRFFELPCCLQERGS